MLLSNIYQLIKRQVEQNPDVSALLAPNRKPLTYGALRRQVEQLANSLAARGLTACDRIALVLPNGPEMVTAFLGVAARATCAPLNPAYHASEFDFYLTDLEAKALLIAHHLDSPARASAQTRGIPVLELTYTPEEAAGCFFLPDDEETNTQTIFSGPDDVALVLHTSGTTAKPKLVPLTHRNLCASAQHIQTTLQLTGYDRCLNIMPLFHIHGLVGAILASLAAGASIVCTPGFQADAFFEWLTLFRPTWYTAVPTMHQAILERLAAHPANPAHYSLRFIRSSSAPLPPQVMQGLEAHFHAPVIEAYGMTEAAHQMASNPLPPLPRKPGTVGLAAGPAIKIIDEAGHFAPAGQTGEIVIRGENVMTGYANNPAANQSAFLHGWFRTGDQGVLDVDGYLSITGRLKEMVNRGGSKIAPREVDEALLDHPKVAQAVAFAAPHPTLGEDLIAAVVLRHGSRTTEPELRQFIFARLADYKVPSRILIVNEIPKGPTGKVQRIGLAEKLAACLKPTYIGPRNPLEEAMAQIWAEALGRQQVGIQDNFFALGGDSLAAESVMLATEELINKRPLTPAILFRAPTIEQLASLLQTNLVDHPSYAVALQSNGPQRPLFLIPGHGGDVFTYTRLVRYLPPQQPVYAFRFPESARQNDEVANILLKEMAARYIAEMRAIQPIGPYRLGGFCFGAELAFEMAQQLHAQRESADFLAIIYAYLPGSIRVRGVQQRLVYHLRNILYGNLQAKLSYIKTLGVNLLERISRKFVPSLTRRLVSAVQTTTPYLPCYYPGKITLFRPLEGTEGLYHDPQMGWGGLAAAVEVHEIPGDKTTIFREPNVQVLAKQLHHCLDELAKMDQPIA